MGQVLTNATALAIAREETPGVLGATPEWLTLEPNSIGTFGATTRTVARSPISRLRQRRKGTIVDLDAAAEFEADVTGAALANALEGFFFRSFGNGDLLFRGSAVTATGYTVAALSASQAARLQNTANGPRSLIHAAGYTTTTNNSPGAVKVLDTAVPVAATDTELVIAGGLTVEGAVSNAEVSLAGVRCDEGDIAFSIVGNIGTLSSGNGAGTAVDFTTLGLEPGQRIHVGGLTAANRFGNSGGAVNGSFGGCRIRTITANAMTVDKIDAALLPSDGTNDGAGGTAVEVDLLFGRFVANATTDNALYQEITHRIEGTLPNLFQPEGQAAVANPNGYQYVSTAFSDGLNVALPLTDKATATFGYIGTDAVEPVDDSERATGAATPIEPLQTGAYNTTLDLFRLGVQDVDDVGLTTDFKSLNFALLNNVTPEKVLGVLGARFVNFGNFEASLTGAALFTDPEVPRRIRQNTTVTGGFGLRNDEGAFFMDLPSGTLSSGGVEYPVNETVRIDLTLTSFVDPTFGTSASASLFPVYPAAA
jgi:hypothetical protein